MSDEGAPRATIRLDESAWPLVLFVFDGEQTEADVTAYLAAQSRHYAREEPFGSVTVMNRFSADRKLLQQIGTWMKANTARVARLHVGGAIVSTSATFRFILSSFYLIAPPANPYTVVDSLEEAVAWSVERLLERGVSVPPTADLVARFRDSPAMP